MSKSSFWENHIQTWQGSGQSQRAYCAAQSLSLASFGYWRHKLKPGLTPAGKGMLPIVMRAADASPMALDVVLPNRLTLRVPLTAEPTQLARWVRVLGAC